MRMGQNLTKIQIWMLAIRPKTLPAAIGPVLVGTGFAIHDAQFNWYPALLALIGALLLQIAANLANDYFDFLKGFDTEDRVGPTRVAASGLLQISELRLGLIINIVIALLIGILLIIEAGVVVLIIGFFSVIFAVLYSGGPYPLAENKLGDIFVLIFFGIIAVNGTYFVQSQTWSGEAFLGSIPVGLLITAILVVNNYRDMDTDKSVGKNTLVVTIGRKNTIFYYIGLFVASYLTPLVYLFWDYTFLVLLPSLSIPLAVQNVRSLRTFEIGPELNKVLAGTARLSLVFSVLFAIGVAF